MGHHLPFFVSGGFFKWLPNRTTADDESLRIDCPVLVTERLVLRAPHDERHPANWCCWPTTAMSRRCWRACRIPMARQRRAPSWPWLECARPGVNYALTLAGTRHLHRLRGAQRQGARARARLLDRRTLLEARLCHGGGACAGRPGVPLHRHHGAACLGAGHQSGVAPRDPQMRLPVCRAGHDELDGGRPGAGRALPARPQRPG